ncbi:H-type lectin domain-containing protein [Jannaschia seohaensis]|uniref:H-type lectin domain-containing protein n=1 Tax=Jannaschia seohaensis TaxID=475081 RepID=A0A2Y9B3A0_9RHOB|nr:H-type lectin domain-containing protein [Jannaschia seohaensis]PWJ15099.1 H-type lectin domain-containing protein [Jannaschia seohaensis]SSA49948.1 H-type lectin domain-containing protein [Jannaschia seohaensis]
MRRLRNHMIGIDQGSEMLFSDFAEGGPMWVGEGPREVRCRVTFSEPFRSPPALMTGLALLDIDSSANLRLDLSHGEVTREGAELILKTWGDSRLARLRADWSAIGEVAGSDEWDLY